MDWRPEACSLRAAAPEIRPQSGKDHGSNGRGGSVVSWLVFRPSSLLGPFRRRWSYVVWAMVAVVVVPSAIVRTASGQGTRAKTSEAEDLATVYVRGLRDRGWHDVVLDYLEQAAADPIASPEFLARVGFERAQTLADLAQLATRSRQQQQLNSRASEEFLRYAQSHPGSKLEMISLSRASSLLTEQALQALDQAARLPPPADDSQAGPHAAARQLLVKSSQALDSLQSSASQQLAALPGAEVPAPMTDLRSLRGQLENKQAEARFQLAKNTWHTASTYAEKSAAHQQTLQLALDQFTQLQAEYPDKLIGFYGRLYQGRCYQQLGKTTEALACYHDLMDQRVTSSDFRRIVARATRRSAELHLAAQRPEQAIAESRAGLEDARREERTHPEWLAVAFRLAQAYLAQAVALESGGTAHGSQAQRMREQAHQLLREVARHPGEFQREATVAARASNSPSLQVQDFAEAFQAGQAALQQLRMSQLADQLAVENNPDSSPALGEQVRRHQRQARHYFERCLSLTDADTPPEKLMAARYYLGWLDWQTGRWPEAAVVGSFLASRFPDDPLAPAAAQLALAAYERLYHQAREADGADTSYAAQQLAEMARQVVARWPTSAAAATALKLLVQVAVSEDRLADAEAMLAQLPETSRGPAMLSLGSSLWSRYLAATKNKPESSSSVQHKLRVRARQLLTEGFQATRDQEKLSTAAVVGALSLAHVLLAEDRAAEALAVLEDPRLGPLTLWQKKSALTQQDALVLEILKTAFRALVAVDPPQPEKAQRVLQALEDDCGPGKPGRDKLFGIYVSLGVGLQGQLQQLAAAGSADRAEQVAAVLGDLLKHVRAQAGGDKSWQSQNWIAHTNLQLARGLSGPAAQEHYRQAAESYRALLDQAQQQPSFAPSPTAVLAVKKRLGDCLLATEDFAQALERYVEILRHKPQLLELQQAAAQALQAWGLSRQRLDKIDEAIHGRPRDQNYPVWGWLRIAKLADNAKRREAQKFGPDSPQAEKYHDIFFAARLQIAAARVAAAQFVPAQQRAQQLRQARQQLNFMKRLYPDLGGPRWQDKYLELIEKVAE